MPLRGSCVYIQVPHSDILWRKEEEKKIKFRVVTLQHSTAQWLMHQLVIEYASTDTRYWTSFLNYNTPPDAEKDFLAKNFKTRLVISKRMQTSHEVVMLYNKHLQKHTSLQLRLQKYAHSTTPTGILLEKNSLQISKQFE